jgi:hypothetical protein
MSEILTGDTSAEREDFNVKIRFTVERTELLNMKLKIPVDRVGFVEMPDQELTRLTIEHSVVAQ